MAIGRTFPSRCKGATLDGDRPDRLDDIAFEGLGQGDDKNDPRRARHAFPDRLLKVAQALRLGFEEEQIYEACAIDPGSSAKLQEIIDLRSACASTGCRAPPRNSAHLKAMGFSDERLAKLAGLKRARSPKARELDGTQSTSASILARQSSPRPPPICTRPMRRASDLCNARRALSDAEKIIILAAALTASARASSSTIAAAMRHSRCRPRTSRPSWSIAIRRPCRPTTTPPTGSISSR
jgi:hypothetical protein